MPFISSLLLILCSLDLLFTVISLEFYAATEANPILNFYLEKYTVYGLIFVKLFLTICSLALFEAAFRLSTVSPSRRKTIIVKYSAAFTVAAYLLIFFFGNLILNKILPP